MSSSSSSSSSIIIAAARNMVEPATPVAKQPAPAAVAPETKAATTNASAVSMALRNGAAASASQVVTFPLFSWMYTVIANQHQHGGGFRQVTQQLYTQGGVRRFYQGALPFVLQMPVARFASITMTHGAFAALGASDLPDTVVAGGAAAGVAGFRGAIMPLTTWGTVSQVNGRQGVKDLLARAKAKPAVLWAGAGGTMAAGWLSHWSWVVTQRRLGQDLPEFQFANGKVLRDATVGFGATVVADTLTNAVRVITTQQQLSRESMSYWASAKKLVKQEGFSGLCGRGLKTKLLVSGAQGALFNVGWKLLAEHLGM